MSTTTTSTTSTSWSSEPPQTDRPNPCGTRTRWECASYARELDRRKHPDAAKVLEGACYLGDQDSCVDAAFLFKTQEPERAVPVARYGCSTYGTPRACTNLGVYLENGIGTIPDPDSALKLYQQYCAKRDQVACRLAGNLYSGTKLGAPQHALAASAYMDACKYGDAGGCRLAPQEARAAGRPLLPGDEEAFLRASCTSAEPDGCWDWATFLRSVNKPARAAAATGCKLGSAASCQLQYQEERAVDNPRAAFDAAKRACELDAKRCWEYGFAQYARGELAASAKTWEAACAQEDASSCVSLGISHAKGEGRPLDGQQAMTEFERACQLGSARGCAIAGELLVDGNVVKADRSRGREFLEKACTLGLCIKLAAGEYAGMLGKKDLVRARTLFVRGCEGNEPKACQWAATMIMLGEGGGPDPYQAASLASRGCEAHEAPSCNLFAYALVEGKGVAKDPPRALALWEDACRTYPEACDSIGEANEKGLGGAPKSLPTAYERYMQACNRGVQLSCKNAQRVAKALRRPPPALPRPTVAPASTAPAGKSAGLPVPDLSGLVQGF